MRENELLETQDVKGFFQEALVDLVDQRCLEVGDTTVSYVANVLTTFMRSDRFYEWTPQGPTLTPLAMIYAEVVQTTSDRHRQRMLRRMGDVALFMAGVFAESFERKAYDVDYYIGMGGAAYSSLSECIDHTQGGPASAKMFAELSLSFADFVQILMEVCDQSEARDDQDVLRWYKLWQRTGSKRAARKLRSAGIDVGARDSGTRH